MSKTGLRSNVCPNFHCRMASRVYGRSSDTCWSSLLRSRRPAGALGMGATHDQQVWLDEDVARRGGI